VGLRINNKPVSETMAKLLVTIFKTQAVQKVPGAQLSDNTAAGRAAWGGNSVRFEHNYQSAMQTIVGLKFGSDVITGFHRFAKQIYASARRAKNSVDPAALLHTQKDAIIRYRTARMRGVNLGSVLNDLFVAIAPIAITTVASYQDDYDQALQLVPQVKAGLGV